MNSRDVPRDHPRPHFVRDNYALLDGTWEFVVDLDDLGASDRWFLDFPVERGAIMVPFPPESPASGVEADVDAPLWYKREFHLLPLDSGRLLLHFEGVDYFASVWVNGQHVGDHEGGQTGFTFDITDAVRGGANSLVVRAVDGRDLDQPRGKQDWEDEPHAIWYRRTSGIWRSVWLERVPSTRLDDITLRTAPDLFTVDFDARVTGAITESLRLELTFAHHGMTLARSSVDVLARRVCGSVKLERPGIGVQPENMWWTPESPNLIDVTARLVSDGVVVDEVGLYLGLRTVATDPNAVMLNGRPYFLRLVLEQAYWPATHLASPSLEDLIDEARLIKSLGFNGIRLHQTSADPRFLSACDYIGLVVLADAAAAYEFSAVALRRTVTEMAALVARDMNHPCVIGWVPFNESWGLPNLSSDASQRDAVVGVAALLKALDPSRIVIGNDGWEFVSGDAVGIHDYAQNGELLHERYGSTSAVRATAATDRPGGRAVVLARSSAATLPVLLSEFGGLSVHQAADAWEAYGDVLSPEELVERLSGMLSVIGPSSGLAGYCYTQFTDTAQERNGLLTAEREPKCAPERLKEIFGETE